MLKIRALKEILSGMIAHITLNTSKITDFSKGSAIRTLLEGVGLTIEEFYFNMADNIQWAIENSVYKAFGFEIQDATPSSGKITVVFKEPLRSELTYPKGTEFATSTDEPQQLFFKSLFDTTAPAGATEMVVTAECTVVGTKGNVPTGKIVLKPLYDPRVLYVTNEEAFSGGTEKESKEQRRKRFLNFITTLSKATGDALIYACTSVKGVQGADILDNRAGLVNLFVHDANGELPSTLREAIQKNIEKFRSAGVEVVLLPVTKISVDLNVEITIRSGYSVDTYQSLVQSVIRNKLNGLPVSQPLVVSELIQQIMNSYDEVITRCNVKTPTGDVESSKGTLVRPGEVLVTCVTEV